MKLCLLLVLAALVPGVSITARGADASALPTLTTARQVFELSREEAARGYPVRLSGEDCGRGRQPRRDYLKRAHSGSEEAVKCARRTVHSCR